GMSKFTPRERCTLACGVARCCQIKAGVVGQDETASGVRAILNFGHTIGHALEAVSGYGKYLHGEAIAIGQAKAAELSSRLLGLATADATRIRELFKEAGLPTRLKASPSLRKKLIQAMKVDKKVSRGEVKFVLARRIGEVQFGCAVPESLVHEVLGNGG